MSEAARVAGARRAVGLSLALAAGAALGASFLRGCPPDLGPACLVTVRVTGEARQVVAVQSAEGFLREAARIDSRTFQVAVPRAVPDPWVVVHGPEGARVETAPLRKEQLAGEALELPLVAVWSTPLRVRREEQRLRFDWSPLPTGEGYPAARRYSLLIDYPRDPSVPAPDQKPGEELPTRGQTSLLSFDPWMELELLELTEYMPALLGSEPEVVLELRAYDPGHTGGAQWVGVRAAWTLGATTVRRLD